MRPQAEERRSEARSRLSKKIDKKQRKRREREKRKQRNRREQDRKTLQLQTAPLLPPHSLSLLPLLNLHPSSTFSCAFLTSLSNFFSSHTPPVSLSLSLSPTEAKGREREKEGKTGRRDLRRRPREVERSLCFFLSRNVSKKRGVKFIGL